MNKRSFRNLFFVISFLVAGVSFAQQTYNSKGKEFWVSVMNAGGNISPITFYITSDVATCGRIEIPLGTFSQNFTVAANSTTSIIMPWGAAYLQPPELDQIINKGVHIITDDSVLVYMSNESSVAYDSEMIYPVQSLGTSYVTPCYWENVSGSGFSQFSIAATQNNTTIQITPNATILGPGPAFTASRTAGTQFSLNLNAGQVYLAVANGDLTGSIITADKPIALFGGATISFVGFCSAGDHLCEQVLPPSNYGTQYVTAPLQTRLGGDMFRITALQNGTSFTINGGAPFVLNANQWKDTVLAVASEIISNKKIMLAQFARGSNCDAQLGDPFMIMLHPITEMNTNSLFFMFNPFSQFPVRYVNIIVATANTGSVQLNGVGIGASFAPVPSNPLYSFAQMTVPVGTNRITCPQGFVANAYAFGGYISYGHAIGDVKNILNNPVLKASCSGNGVVLNATQGSGYIWSPATSLNCSTCQSVTATPTSAASYTVNFTSATGCADVLYFNVDVDTVKDASITSVPNICLSDPPFNYMAVDTGGVWTGPGITNSALGTFDPATAGVGTHTIIYSISGLCGDVDTTVISVIQLANSTISAVGPFCENDPPLNLNTVTAGGIWSGSGITNTATGVFNPSVAGVGTHSITYAIAGSCGDTGYAEVVVNASPVASVSAVSFICLGDSIMLSASGGSTYLWSNGSPDSTLVLHPTNAGTYTYSVIVANANCASRDSVTFTVTALPAANAGPDDTICIGQSVNLIGLGGNNYLWNTGETANLINVSPANDSTYTLVAYSGACTDTDMVNIIVAPYPLANAGSDTYLLPGEITILNASGGGAYSWSPAVGLSCTNCVSPVASPAETTTYILTVTDSYGCTDSDTITITIEKDCGSFYMPNAFSPNGDGENDVLQVYSKCVSAILVEIFDRWGKKVAEIKNTSDVWDGTYKGEFFNSDVFVYSAKVKFYNGEEIERKGTVSLVR